jgi:hypothetical protein
VRVTTTNYQSQMLLCVRGQLPLSLFRLKRKQSARLRHVKCRHEFDTRLTFTSPLPILADLHASYCFCSFVIFLSLSKIILVCLSTNNIYLAQYQYRPTEQKNEQTLSQCQYPGGAIEIPRRRRRAAALFNFPTFLELP